MSAVSHFEVQEQVCTEQNPAVFTVSSKDNAFVNVPNLATTVACVRVCGFHHTPSYIRHLAGANVAAGVHQCTTLRAHAQHAAASAS